MDDKSIKIMEKAINKVKKLGTTWRVSYTIGFRNGDVHGSGWRDENLLDETKEEIIIKQWAKKYHFDYRAYEKQLAELIDNINSGRVDG